MGFLDRMVAGLVADATGINSRTARKMLKGKGLLMLAAGESGLGVEESEPGSEQLGQPRRT